VSSRFVIHSGVDFGGAFSDRGSPKPATPLHVTKKHPALSSLEVDKKLYLTLLTKQNFLTGGMHSTYVIIMAHASNMLRPIRACMYGFIIALVDLSITREEFNTALYTWLVQLRGKNGR